MPNRLDAVALDLDGTLLDSRGAVAPATLEVLGEAAGRGVEVFIVTGRPEPDVLRILDRAGLRAAAFPHAFVAEERDLHDRAGEGFAPRQPRNRERHAREHAMSLGLLPLLQACRAELAAIDPDFSCFDEATVRRRGFLELHFASRDLAESAAGLLRGRLGGEARAVRNGTLVALRLPESAKGPCLAELAASRGLAPERVLAMGDSDNDRSMLDGSHGFLPAAPANADPDLRALVRARGGYVSAAERSLGVAEAVRAALA